MEPNEIRPLKATIYCEGLISLEDIVSDSPEKAELLKTLSKSMIFALSSVGELNLKLKDVDFFYGIERNQDADEKLHILVNFADRSELNDSEAELIKQNFFQKAREVLPEFQEEENMKVKFSFVFLYS